MKTFGLVFLTLAFQTTFSQTWEKVDIDENVSITIPSPAAKEIIGDKIKVTATTPLGYLTIDRTMHSDSTQLDVKIDHLKVYADGVIMGMKYSQATYEIIENTDGLINDVKVRNIVFRTNTGQLNQLCLVIIDRKIYHIKFREYTAPSDEERKKIFSSIQIK